MTLFCFRKRRRICICFFLFLLHNLSRGRQESVDMLHGTLRGCSVAVSELRQDSDSKPARLNCDNILCV